MTTKEELRTGRRVRNGKVRDLIVDNFAGGGGASWLLSSSSDPRALAVVDGTGIHDGAGPHYSRRTPGSRTFTGVGQEIVLVTADGNAVWAVVRQRTPTARGTGSSRGRGGATDGRPRFVWRNMLFRNLGGHRSSDLILSAHRRTIEEWVRRYGKIPPETLRTEVDAARIKSTNPGYCYKVAGWTPIKRVGTKIYLAAPAIVDDERGQLELGLSGAA